MSAKHGSPFQRREIDLCLNMLCVNSSSIFLCVNSTLCLVTVPEFFDLYSILHRQLLIRTVQRSLIFFI